MALTLAQESLVESRLANEKKSVALAYLLLICFGVLGVHRFYLGRRGLLFLVLSVLSFGIVGLLWSIVDLFLIPGMVRKDTDEKRQKAVDEVRAFGPSGIPA